MKQSIGLLIIKVRRSFWWVPGDVGGTLARPTGQIYTLGGLRYARYVRYTENYLTLPVYYIDGFSNVGTVIREFHMCQNC